MVRRIGIYSPYLKTFGGGERYMLTLAEVLTRYGSVEVLVDGGMDGQSLSELKLQMMKVFNLDLESCSFLPSPNSLGLGFWQKLRFWRRYDLLVAVTDGSIFYSSAKKSFLHIQSPLNPPSIKSWQNRLKLMSWKAIIYNSEFTKKYAQKHWGRRGVVIYPPVDIERIQVGEKHKIILSVGRFFGYLKEKKHLEMINAFKSLIDSGKAKGWKLRLVGSASVGDQPYLDELKKISAGYPIELMPNLEYHKLMESYGHASIYWHAMGYQETDPTKMEHFGITTVEAMAGGAVPVVIKKGGQEEIVSEGESGLFWETLDELVDESIKLIQDNQWMENLSKQAVIEAERFSKDKFAKQIKELIW